MGRTILVCGGRDFGQHNLADRQYAFAVLDRLHAADPISMVVHGDAKGADRVAKRWAEVRGVPSKAYPADWGDISAPGAVIRQHPDGSEYNAAAGGLRNQQMLDENPEISLVVAFPGQSGTADMISKARRKRIAIQHEVKAPV